MESVHVTVSHPLYCGAASKTPGDRQPARVSALGPEHPESMAPRGENTPGACLAESDAKLLLKGPCHLRGRACLSAKSLLPQGRLRLRCQRGRPECAFSMCLPAAILLAPPPTQLGPAGLGPRPEPRLKRCPSHPRKGRATASPSLAAATFPKNACSP